MNRRTFLRSARAALLAGGAAAVTPSTSAAMPERFTLMGVGDCLLARRVRRRKDEPFLELVEMLRTADCTWGNCEMVISDGDHLYPQPKGLDPHILSPAWAADELAWLGIDFVGTANNHTVDFGHQGLFDTLDHLERVEIDHAGAGRDLPAALAPGYRDTGAGRVAQVNACSTYEEYFPAGPPHPWMNGRPGINPLAREVMPRVEEETWNRLREVQNTSIELMGYREFGEVIAKMEESLATAGRVWLPERGMVVKGEEAGLEMSANPGHIERITASLTVARRQARVLLATLHAHEAWRKLEYSAPFIAPFARATIDAGADVFFAAGPHVLRGIELYEGKPIFHGLGNFVFHYESVHQLPAEAYMQLGLEPDTVDSWQYYRQIPYHQEARFWQAIVPRLTWSGADLVEIELFPITLGFDQPVYRRGTPELATGAQAREILEGLAELSADFGTSIQIDGDIGRVDLAS
ncbi:MAG: CapA family protein [Acidobacteriota bacterium]